MEDNYNNDQFGFELKRALLEDTPLTLAFGVARQGWMCIRCLICISAIVSRMSMPCNFISLQNRSICPWLRLRDGMVMWSTSLFVAVAPSTISSWSLPWIAISVRVTSMRRMIPRRLLHLIPCWICMRVLTSRAMASAFSRFIFQEKTWPIVPTKAIWVDWNTWIRIWLREERVCIIWEGILVWRW